MPDPKARIEAAREVGDQGKQWQMPQQRSGPAGGEPRTRRPGGGPDPRLQPERHEESQVRVHGPDAKGGQAGDQERRGAALGALATAAGGGGRSGRMKNAIAP